MSSPTPTPSVTVVSGRLVVQNDPLRRLLERLLITTSQIRALLRGDVEVDSNVDIEKE